jgi:hypothetical protein
VFHPDVRLADVITIPSAALGLFHPEVRPADAITIQCPALRWGFTQTFALLT